MEDQVTTDLRFSIVPHWIIKHDISDRALRLYSVLAGFADSETNQAFPGRTRLSKELRCSLKSVDRAVSELEAIGAIRKKQRVKDGHYQSSLYTVVRIDQGSGVTQPRVTDDATPCQDGRDPVSPVTHITRTTELELLKQEPLNVERPKKEHRIPDDWKPSNDLLALFATKWPDLDPEVDVETFTLYWQSRTERRADWDKTFVVWMNKEQRQRSKYSRKTFQEQAWDKTLKAAEAFLADEDEVTQETNPNGDNRLWINFKNGDE
jgi:hypothetical protein